MTKIAELLGLKPEATEDQIVKALNKRFATSDAAAAELEKLGAEFRAAKDELDKLRKLPKHDTANVNAAALAEKIASGLTRDQALEVLANQAEHDKTKPHDPAPKA